MTFTQGDRIIIEGITEPVILRYFESLNAGDFETTVSLFASDGVLYAPFESAIVGQNAIATYLKTEAQGILLYPLEGFTDELADELSEIYIQGQVQTSLFKVNVAWKFILNSAKEIVSVKVKLLASLAELVKLRR